MISYKQYLLSESDQDEKAYKDLISKIQNFVMDKEMDDNSDYYYDEMKNDPDFADYDDDNVRDYIYHVYSSMNNVRELLTLYHDIAERSYPLTEEDKWLLIKHDPQNITIISHPSKEMQEYIITRSPFLIKSIPHLDPELRKKYAQELDIAGISL
jgi:hypothetical protein